MDFEREDQPLALAPRVYATLVALLLCLGAVPFFFWLGEQRLVPWADEARWLELRQSNAIAPGISATDRIDIRRSSCFGSCPQYSLTLFASGRVEFTGEMYVCALGRHIAQVDAEAATQLIADLAASGYFDLTWKPGEIWSDAPSANTRLTVGSRSRGIDHYHGDEGAPRLLDDMERSIDEVAGTARWLAKLDGYKRYCLTADGKRTRLLRSPEDTLTPADEAAGGD
jgi:hypothetical protein